MQKESRTPFDYSILKSNAPYDKKIRRRIEAVYKEYQSVSAKYMQEAKKNRIKPEEWKLQKYLLKDTFKRLCYKVCPNEDILCDIILDLCYNTLSSKQFAWDICGPVFIKNLLRLNNYQISYPEKSENGDIFFGGERFYMVSVKIPIPEVSEKDFTKEDTDPYDS